RYRWRYRSFPSPIPADAVKPFFVSTDAETSRGEVPSFSSRNLKRKVIRVLRETHDASAEVQQRLEHAGGYNVLGQPAFRVVWGWSRLSWIGGRWEDRDSSG